MLIGLVVISLLTSIFTHANTAPMNSPSRFFAALGFFSLPGLAQVIMQETAKGNHGALGGPDGNRLKAVLPYCLVLLMLAAYYQFIAAQPILARTFAIISLVHPLKSALIVTARICWGGEIIRCIPASRSSYKSVLR